MQKLRLIAILFVISFTFTVVGCAAAKKLADDYLAQPTKEVEIIELVTEIRPVLDYEGLPVIDDEGNIVTKEVQVHKVTGVEYIPTGPSKAEGAMDLAGRLLNTTGGKGMLLANLLVTAVSGWYTKKYQFQRAEKAKAIAAANASSEEDKDKEV